MNPGAATITARSNGASGTIVVEVKLGRILVNASANPTTVHSGELSRITVFALSEQNTPVAEANVLVQTVNSGLFQESGSSTIARGRTDAAGKIQITWRYQGDTACRSNRSFYITVSKRGYTDGKGAVVIFLEPRVLSPNC
jgi:hypothetical protein